VTGNETIGQIIHDLLLVELFDVEYYRDLEMWVRGCDDNDAGNIMKSTIMNFNDHKSKMSKRNLYSK